MARKRLTLDIHRLGAVSLAAGALLAWAGPTRAAEPVQEFQSSVQPILTQYCYDCHADGVNKGQVALDQFKTEADIRKNPELWWKVLKNVRAGIMPPLKKPHPNDQEKSKLVDWIKFDAFGINAKDIDPGRATVRRLNRVEYRNTVRVLMGYDFNATEEFPPDDTGYGFDTIGEVLSVSPMLLEKYMQAAETIVDNAVPIVSKVVTQESIAGNEFLSADGDGGGAGGEGKTKKPPVDGSKMAFYKEANVSSTFDVRKAGDYRLVLNFVVRGAFDFDPGRCDVAFKVDGVEQWRHEFKWDAGKKFQYDLQQKFEPGEHTFLFELRPLVPANKQRFQLDLQVATVDVQGPLDQKFWTAPPNYHRFFPREAPPTGAAERNTYAREVLGAFTSKAFRRPVDDAVLDRLVNIAEIGYTSEGKGFEESMRRAMVAVLASPRFLFRVEQGVAPTEVRQASVALDEYALASRLSYFLWSGMPDEELRTLAAQKQLRAHLGDQVKRMLKDVRGQALIENFAGQWLELRDVGGVSINVGIVFAQDAAAAPKPGAPPASQPTSRPAGNGQRRFGFNRPPILFDDPLRRALRREPEMLIGEVMRDDRSLSELLDGDHTYVNDVLAKLYNIPNITGTEMRRVPLRKDSPRGGLLTTAAVLAVTSNPTRTSPVKRGQFVLDNILGMPAPAPPPNIPPLEDAEKTAGQAMSFRQVLELHRNQALCRSCHARMDPLGLAFENFNALGSYREKERGLPIDSAGQLLTGEKFKDARDLKVILKDKHLTDFYRCLTEKMLTYALGRGLDYNDVETVDRIVDRMNREDGRFSALINGIVESAPFERRRVLSKAGNRAVQVREPGFPEHAVTTTGTP